MSHSLATAGLDKLLIRSPRWAGMALADLLPLDNSVRGHRSHRSVTYWVTAVTAGQRHPSAAGPGPATSRLTVTYPCSGPDSADAWGQRNPRDPPRRSAMSRGEEILDELRDR